MKIVVASDKFRGTVSAPEVVEAVRVGVGSRARVVGVPMADGGEGTLDALGGANRTSTVTGPLGDAVDAAWRLHRGLAVIEMAQASGLVLAGGSEGNDPLGASTTGTGELIAEAVEAGARRVIVGVGGSATSDGGFGALRAMYPLQRLRGVELSVACDVRTRFLDAPKVFGPQKGATPAQVELLTRRLDRLADMFLEEYGVEVRDVDRAGAAGGLAGGLFAIGARLRDGFGLISDEVGLYDQIEDADLVITGEGFLDQQSFEGKVVGGVQALADAAGVPVLAIAGEVFDDVGDRIDAVSLTQRFGAERSLRDTAACIAEVVATVFTSS